MLSRCIDPCRSLDLVLPSATPAAVGRLPRFRSSKIFRLSQGGGRERVLMEETCKIAKLGRAMVMGGQRDWALMHLQMSGTNQGNSVPPSSGFFLSCC